MESQFMRLISAAVRDRSVDNMPSDRRLNPLELAAGIKGKHSQLAAASVPVEHTNRWIGEHNNLSIQEQRP